MSLAIDTWAYAIAHLDELRQATIDHLLLVTMALSISIIICLPLGIWSSRSRGTANVVINGVNGLRVIPSLAVLFLMVPYMGVVRVEKVMTPLTNSPSSGLTIHQDESLRSALPDLLRSEVDYLTVVDGEKRPLGHITFDNIRSSIG